MAGVRVLPVRRHVLPDQRLRRRCARSTRAGAAPGRSGELRRRRLHPELRDRRGAHHAGRRAHRRRRRDLAGRRPGPRRTPRSREEGDVRPGRRPRQDPHALRGSSGRAADRGGVSHRSRALPRRHGVLPHGPVPRRRPGRSRDGAAHEGGPLRAQGDVDDLRRPQGARRDGGEHHRDRPAANARDRVVPGSGRRQRARLVFPGVHRGRGRIAPPAVARGVGVLRGLPRRDRGHDGRDLLVCTQAGRQCPGAGLVSLVAARPAGDPRAEAAGRPVRVHALPGRGRRRRRASLERGGARALLRRKRRPEARRDRELARGRHPPAPAESRPRARSRSRLPRRRARPELRPRARRRPRGEPQRPGSTGRRGQDGRGEAPGRDALLHADALLEGGAALPLRIRNASSARRRGDGTLPRLHRKAPQRSSREN